MDNTLLARPVAGRARHVPFMALLDAQCTSADDGVATVELALRPELCNNHGSGHGGVVMSLLDSAMAHAALSRIAYAREVVTIDMHIGFMRPVSGHLVATGRTTGGGKSVCFCEAEIVDGTGVVVAKAMGTFRYRAPADASA
ncbi:PaaI family thioesterase [Pseudorhodoferax sp. Leaf267]|uniref:PaaI family thioesterase n=1 Tax=Pseudorhodoferax sp. Leaf267 TaxID=1736316 RepID=UPI001F3893A1|nr:PaaI family thioesterase [Pseudorhodoferax sp. Leaf267]